VWQLEWINSESGDSLPEKLQPTLGDPSEDEGDDSGSETSVEDQ